MSCMTCGCTAQPCGCCEGVQVLTPQRVFNRPGLPALSSRVGTHASFLGSMKARLSTIEVDGLGLDGQPLEHLRPLQGLSTRDPGDPSIALLDAWASVGDVLTFYQERNADEAYLRTATERRSVLELSRLVGYTPRPGVAATAHMAYTLDANQAEPVTIAAGARSQSVPDPDETAQAFETSDDLLARREWNNLQVRLQQPQNITLDNVLTLTALQVAGTSTNLRAGDRLLFVFSADGATSAARVVAGVDTQFADQRTAVQLRPIDALLLKRTGLLLDFITQATVLLASDATGSTRAAIRVAELILGQIYLGTPPDVASWANRILQVADAGPAPLLAAITALRAALEATQPPATGTAFTDPAAFASALLKPAVPQVRNTLQLPRSLSQAFLPEGNLLAKAMTAQALERRSDSIKVMKAPVYADVGTQLLVSFVPELKRSYYAAWAGAVLNPAPAKLQAVYAMRARASLFGATASKLPTYTGDVVIEAALAGVPPGILKPPNLWDDWTYGDAGDETSTNAFLDQANENVTAGGYAIVELNGASGVLKVAQASTLPRTAYGLSGQTTQLLLETPNAAGWRSFASSDQITALRKTKFYVQSEPLTLVDEPITSAVADRHITLDGLYDGLTSGRWVMLEGERADIDHVAGVRVAELQMIAGLSHTYDARLPGDSVHTSLILSTELAYAYKRDTLKIYGNVVKATHGETRFEVLGSGDGAQALQSFVLKQPPLTFVPAPTAAGALSTLVVRVNDVAWHETDSLAELGPKDHSFITLTDDNAVTTLSFGNGEHGARLPTGMLNVKAVYRNGIGKAGNVKAGQIKLLQTKPLGVKEVVNPLRASGGADKESRDLARENAPLSVMALDRLVSVQDYADFTRRFAGIAKAIALQVSDGRSQLVYLTIAGVDDIPIDTSSDLYQNLLTALRAAGDPDLPLRVELRELKALVMSANIKLAPDYEWESVVSAVRAQLLARFGFDQRALGQPALLCEVIAAMQQVRGVEYVDVDAFGAVAQNVAEDGGNGGVPTRRFVTQDDIAQAVADIVSAGKPRIGKVRGALPPNVDAWPGGADQGVLWPAELVVFVPGVADTLVLNQIP
jgi:hypothetical protein